MNIFKIIKFPDILTLLNAAFGLLSIFFSIDGEFGMAILFLLIAGLFDLIDGKFASFMKKDKMLKIFGRELDSLADVVSFAVAPVVFGFCLIGKENNWFSILAFVIFISCCILRLARFNAFEQGDYFEGMPVPLNALLFLLPYYLKLSVVYFSGFYLLSAILMISTIKIKKIKIK